MSNIYSKINHSFAFLNRKCFSPIQNLLQFHYYAITVTLRLPYMCRRIPNVEIKACKAWVTFDGTTHGLHYQYLLKYLKLSLQNYYNL